MVNIQGSVVNDISPFIFDLPEAHIRRQLNDIRDKRRGNEATLARGFFPASHSAGIGRRGDS
jgi:hypothetical protein